ncbi:hypothetical protein PHYSODRAFT_329726 [Phytophthora sojae]|uniref:Uncharacterized protein n=1 Tax=Phytophthora sojae (strain P6497) TaxID=1094619 RepID=G4Z7S6_PHYSP|nr:hypothetical protein PHYSODRAFT_329726 [Phytophthora sojae]EGZ21829.1 hypothetical protein PHYSODRAFT_329726 [Phytophthora sojae]|eukprot:XP_009524546.1 hypothetical protein PHYSODRAFT_329726 [Phytophthora sojae]
MSPTGSPSAATSEDFEDSRGDHEDLEEYSEARDDLHFDPSDQETMEQDDQLQLIVRLQSELAELKKQLATRAPRAPSMSDTSMETAPPSPKKPKIKDVRCSNFKGNEVYPGLV